MSGIRKVSNEATVNILMKDPQIKKVKFVQKKYGFKTQGQAVNKIIDEHKI